jgi:hypothetical protein
MLEAKPIPPGPTPMKILRPARVGGALQTRLKLSAAFSHSLAQEQARREGLTELIVRPETFEDLVWQVHALLERCAERCAVE